MAVSPIGRVAFPVGMANFLIGWFYLLLSSWWTRCLTFLLGFCKLGNGCLPCQHEYLQDGMLVSPFNMVVLMMEWLLPLLVWLSSWWNRCLPCPHCCLPDGLVFPPVGMNGTSPYPLLVRTPVQLNDLVVDQVYLFPPGDVEVGKCLQHTPEPLIQPWSSRLWQKSGQADRNIQVCGQWTLVLYT